MAGLRKKSPKAILMIMVFAGCLLSFHKVASSQESVSAQEPITKDQELVTKDQKLITKDQDIKAVKQENASMKEERRFVAGVSLKNGGAVTGDSDSGEDAFDLHLGGVFQVDYRYYQESPRADNRFDIRRASLVLNGLLNPVIYYRLEYELQGNDPQNLTEGYGEWEIDSRHLLRIGQFKEPYGLEWQTQDQALFLVERSMGYYLTPQRDVGIMLCESSSQEVIHYALGVFNGDGKDGSARGSRNDQPEVAIRLVYVPFKKVHGSWLESLQIGGSATQAKIDLSNVALEVKSSGMVGTTRSIFVLNQNTKFGVLQNVQKRNRWALEAGWALGPLAVQGEYLNLSYKDLESSGELVQNADFSSWYGSVLLFLTGESPVFKEGVLQPVKPKNNFDWSAGTWGGLALAARADHFSADEDWIKNDALVSVSQAKAYSVALNWIINPRLRLIMDYTYTNFSDPLRVRVNPDGKIDYIHDEHVLTTRFYIAF